MAKMIQVRNVPDRLHRELVRRAAGRGLTLTEFIEQILEREVARPPAAEVFDRIARRPAVELRESVADLIREERARRGSR
ncbi:MAG: FitA-like ribbon-helix-helix domain-containing protein [Thermoanaerobaculia bacterium]